MEKLTLEQKAKAYDTAIEGLRNAFYNDNNRMCKEYRQAVIKVIEPIFPELKESEDENIKKCIIDCIRYMKAHYCLPSRYTSKQYGTWIDWLEKAVTPTLQDWNDYKDKPGELWNAYGKGLANGIERGKASVKNHPQDYGLALQGEPEDKGEISDGYHTFNELYYYRMLYNAAFFNTLPKEWVHKSKKHYDGKECFDGGWFIVMANLPTGQISNHYELKDWDLFQIPEKETADEWDGHTPQEAAERLHKYLLDAKELNQKSITDFSNLKTWKYIVDAVLTEKEGIGQYLDSPFTEEIAKKLQKRFGNIKQTPCNKEDIGIDTILDEANIKSYKEGDVWCILYGENVDKGICGYGNTKEDAFMDFLSNLLEEKTIHNAKQVSTNIIWHDASNISIDTPDEHKEIICETEDLIGNKIHTIAYYSKADNRFFIEYRVISNVKRWVYLNDVLSYTTLDITKSMSLARQYRNYREECGVKDAIVLAEIENAYFTALTDNSVYINPLNVEKDDTKI